MSPFLRPGLYVAAGALVFSAGYLAGHRAAPAVVQTKDKVEQHETEKVDAKVDTKTASTKDTATDVEKETRTEKFPDGRVVTVTKYVDRTKVVAGETKVEVRERVVQVDKVRAETHEKLVLRRPDWALGLTAGLSAPGLLGRPTTSYLPLGIARSAVFGLSIERRIFSGLYAGLNANSQGVVGVGVRFTW